MDPTLGESLNEIAQDFSNNLKKLNRSIENACNALSKGEVAIAQKLLSELGALAFTTSQLIDRAESGVRDAISSVGGIDGLRQRCLEVAQGRFPDTKVFVSENSLIIFPIVIKFEQTKEDIRIIIAGEATSTVSANRVADLVSAVMKDNFDPTKFLRSVYQAYKSISTMTGKRSVPLEDIRQVLSVTKETVNGYSSDSFESDLQRWNASDAKTVSGKTARLEHIAASRDGYPIISSNGARSLLSNISFE
jgi:uncharacterized protein YukE